MLLQQIEHPDAAIFHVKGRIDAASTAELEERVLASLEQGRRNLVLDFSELEYINSGGLRILVMSHHRLHPRGGQVVVCGVRDYIAEIFDISGYSQIFPMYADLEQALAAFMTGKSGQ